MILFVDGHRIDYFNEFSVSIGYSQIASSFAFNFLFDPDNIIHREIVKPGAYKRCYIEDDKGNRLITGIILDAKFSKGPVKKMISIAGMSLTGVLDDCQIPIDNYPLQSDGLSLKQITEKLIKPFGLKLKVIDSVNNRSKSPYYKEISTKSNERIDRSVAYETQSIASYLIEIATHKNIIITHDNFGNLLFTEANTKQEPVIEYNDQNTLGIDFELSYSGKSMHSSITVQRQADYNGGNAGEYTIKNPYCKEYRPKVLNQNSGNDNNTKESARAALGSELANIQLTIENKSWNVGDDLILPNSIITIIAPELSIYNKTRFFIESVTYKGDNQSRTCSITCLLPEVYENGPVKNIFE